MKEWKMKHIYKKEFSESARYNATLDALMISSCSFVKISSIETPGALFINMGKKGIPSITNTIFQKCTSVASHGAFFVSAESFNFCGCCIENCETYTRCHAFSAVTNPLGKFLINESFISKSTFRKIKQGQASSSIYSGRNVINMFNSSSNMCVKGAASFAFVYPNLAFMHYSMIVNNSGPSIIAVSFSERPIEVLSSMIINNTAQTIFHLPLIQTTFTNCIFKKNTFEVFGDAGESKVIILTGCYLDVDFESYQGVSSSSFCKDNVKSQNFPSILVHNIFEGVCRHVEFKTPLPTPTPLPSPTFKPTATFAPTAKPTPLPTPTFMPTATFAPSPIPTPPMTPLPSPLRTPPMTPAPTGKNRVPLPDDPDDPDDIDDDINPREAGPAKENDDVDIPGSRPIRDDDDDDNDNPNWDSKKAKPLNDDDDDNEDSDNDQWDTPKRPVSKDGRPLPKEQDEEELRPRRQRRRDDDDDDDDDDNDQWRQVQQEKEQEEQNRLNRENENIDTGKDDDE